MCETCRGTVVWRRGKGHARWRMRSSPEALPLATKQRDTIMQHTVERSRDRWHQGSTATVRFGQLWIFTMMVYWVAIGARTANKLSPPYLKGNALAILKSLPCSPKLRLQVGDADQCEPCGGFTWNRPGRPISLIHCVICAHECSWS